MEFYSSFLWKASENFTFLEPPFSCFNTSYLTWHQLSYWVFFPSFKSSLNFFHLCNKSFTWHFYTFSVYDTLNSCYLCEVETIRKNCWEVDLLLIIRCTRHEPKFRSLIEWIQVLFPFSMNIFIVFSFTHLFNVRKI